jgi:hypothetical protein
MEQIQITHPKSRTTRSHKILNKDRILLEDIQKFNQQIEYYETIWTIGCVV